MSRRRSDENFSVHVLWRRQSGMACSLSVEAKRGRRRINNIRKYGENIANNRTEAVWSGENMAGIMEKYEAHHQQRKRNQHLWYGNISMALAAMANRAMQAAASASMTLSNVAVEAATPWCWHQIDARRETERASIKISAGETNKRRRWYC